MKFSFYRFLSICCMRTLYKKVSKGNISFHKDSTGTDIFLNETSTELKKKKKKKKRKKLFISIPALNNTFTITSYFKRDMYINLLSFFFFLAVISLT